MIKVIKSENEKLTKEKNSIFAAHDLPVFLDALVGGSRLFAKKKNENDEKTENKVKTFNDLFTKKQNLNETTLNKQFEAK